MRRASRHHLAPAGATVALLALLAVAGPSGAGASEPIVSRYTYAEAVFPILRDRCGSCHAPAGAARSLLSYGEAAAEAGAIREQLTAAAMPPWFVTAAGPAISGGHALSNRERDILITWAAGGTPAGDLSRVPPRSAPAFTWRSGEPDRLLELPEASIPAGHTQSRRTHTISTGFTEDAWVRGVDVIPGDPSVVRAVTVTLVGGPVLAVWVPGEAMTLTPAGTAFRVPARASLTVEVLYRSRQPDTSTARTDRTRLGFHLTKTPGPITAVTTLSVDDAPPLSTAVRVLAVRTVFAEPLDAVRVEATLPAGTSVPLLDLRGARPDWGRRYWLANPVDLPSGATVRVHVSGENPATELLVAGLPAR